MDAKDKKEEQLNHYDAFISYRHVELDSFVAEKLHKMLERYHIPAKIRKQTGKERINRVFRDREELPLSADLGENINIALQNSDFLIVLCSPEALESRWVQSEIELFLKYHSLEQVLAVLVRGEPEEAFPEKLCYKEEKARLNTGEEAIVRIPVEPLAADVRGKSKKEIKKKLKDEFLRLVAPMISCTYDELRQRRQEYRFKQLAAVSVLVIAVLSGFLGLSAVSYRQYRNAQKNQAKYMAEVSDQLLSDGNRAEALESVLSVQPKGDQTKPVVPEQIYALNNALYSYRYTNHFTFEKSAYCEMDGQTAEAEDNTNTEQKLSPGGAYYLCLDDDGTAYVLDGETGSCQWKIRPEDLDQKAASYDEFCWSSPIDDQKAYLLSETGLFIVDTTKKMLEKTIDLPQNIDGYKLKCDANNHYVAIAYEKTVLIYSLKNEKWIKNAGLGKLTDADNDVSQIVLPEDGSTVAVACYNSSESDKGGVYIFNIKKETFKTLSKTGAKSIGYAGKNKLIALLDDGNKYVVSCYDLKTGEKSWEANNLTQKPRNYGKISGIYSCQLYIQEMYDVVDTEKQYTYKLKNRNLTAAAVYLGQYLYCFDPENGKILRTQDYPGDIINLCKADEKTLMVFLASGEIYAHRIGWESDSSGTDKYTYLDTNNYSYENYDVLHKVGDVGTDINFAAYNAEKQTVIQAEKETHSILFSPLNEDEDMKDLPITGTNISVRYFTTNSGSFRCIIYKQTDDSSYSYGIKVYKTGSSEVIYQAEMEKEWFFVDGSVKMGDRNGKPVLCFVTEKYADNNGSVSTKNRYQFTVVSLEEGKVLGQSDIGNGDNWKFDEMLYLDSMDKILIESRSEGYYTVDIAENKWKSPAGNEIGEDFYSAQLFVIDEETIGITGGKMVWNDETSDVDDYEELSLWHMEEDEWICKKTYQLNSEGESSLRENSVAVGQKEKMAAVCYSGGVQIINLETGRILRDISADKDNNAQIGFLNDDKELVMFSPEKRQFYIWNIKSGELLVQEQVDMASNTEDGELIVDDNGKYFAIKKEQGSVLDIATWEVEREKDDNKNLMIYFIEEEGSVCHYADVPYGYASFEAGEILSIPDNYSGICRYTSMYSFEELYKKAEQVLGERNVKSYEN